MLRRHPKLLRALRWLTWPALIALALTVALFIRLQYSPMRLPRGEAFMREQVSKAFASPVVVASVQLDLLWDRFLSGPELLLSDVSIKDPESDASVKVRSVRLNLQVGRLLLGQFVVEDLSVEDGVLGARRGADARMRLPSLAASRFAPSSEGQTAWTQLLLPRGHSSVAGRLHHIRVERVTLEISSPEEQMWQLRLSRFDLRRTRHASKGEASLMLLVDGRNVPIDLALTSEPDPDAAKDAPASRVELTFRHLRPKLAGWLSPELRPLAFIDAGFSGAVSVELDRDGIPLIGRFNLASSKGSLGLARDARVPLGEIDVAGTYAFARAALDVGGEVEVAGAKMRLAKAQALFLERHFSATLASSNLDARWLERVLPHDVAPATRAEGNDRLREASVDELSLDLTGTWNNSLEGALVAWVTGEVSARSGEGTFSAKGTSNGGEGTWALSAKADRFPVLPFAHLLEHSSGSVYADFPISGTFELTKARDQAPVFQAEFSAGAGSLNLPSQFKRPFAFKAFEGAVSRADADAPLAFEIRKLVATNLHVAMDGKVNLKPNADPLMTAAVRVRETHLSALDPIWPERLLPKTRGVLFSIVREGVAQEAEARFTVGPSRRPGFIQDLQWMEGRGRFHSAEVDTRLNLPHFTGLRGRGEFSHVHASFSVEAGEWNGGTVRNGSVLLAGLQSEAPWLDVGLQLDGGFQTFRPLLVHAPAAVRQEVAAASETSGGTGELKLGLRLPMLAHITFADAQLDGRLAFSGVTLDAPSRFARLQDLGGTMQLSTAAGRAKLSIAAQAGDSALLESVQGPISLDMIYETADEEGRLEVNADLGKSSVRQTLLGLDKAQGVPQTLRVPLVFRNGELAEIREASFTGAVSGKLSATWSAEAWEPFPARLAATNLRVGETNGSIEVTRSPERLTTIRVNGGTWDLRPLRKAVQSGGSGAKAAKSDPWILSMRGSRLLWLEEIPFTEADVELNVGKDGAVQSARTSMNLPNNRYQVIELDSPSAEGGIQKWRISSEDAATTLRLAGIEGVLAGGMLSAEGTHGTRPTSAWDGTIEMRNFRVISAPLTARILSAAALTGMVDLMRGRGLQFTRLSTNFHLEGSTLTLSDTAAHGAEMGILVPSARVDLSKRTAEFEGSLWPGYALNAGFRALPLVREILTGPERQGIVGFKFTGSGPLSDPKVSASALPRFSVISNLGRLLRLTDGPAKPGPPAREEAAPPTQP